MCVNKYRTTRPRHEKEPILILAGALLDSFLGLHAEH